VASRILKCAQISARVDKEVDKGGTELGSPKGRFQNGIQNKFTEIRSRAPSRARDSCDEKTP